MSQVRFIVGIDFLNLVSGEPGESGEKVSEAVFSKDLIFEYSISTGSKIFLPVGNGETRTIFGRGPFAFEFTVKDISIKEGTPSIVLHRMEFSQAFKEAFNGNWEEAC